MLVACSFQRWSICSRIATRMHLTPREWFDSFLSLLGKASSSQLIEACTIKLSSTWRRLPNSIRRTRPAPFESAFKFDLLSLSLLLSFFFEHLIQDFTTWTSAYTIRDCSNSQSLPCRCWRGKKYHSKVALRIPSAKIGCTHSGFIALLRLTTIAYRRCLMRFKPWGSSSRNSWSVGFIEDWQS